MAPHPEAFMRFLKSAVVALALPLQVIAADTPTTQPVIVPASVEAFEMPEMYAKTSGYVKVVKVDLGDHVKAGDVLAEIDVPELAMDLAEANATLNAKKKLVEAADAATKQSKMALSVANHQLERYKAESHFQDITLKRQEELFANKAITDQQLDEVKNKVAVATADVGVAEAKTAAAEADILGTEANRAVAAAQADVAEAQINKINTLLGYTKIIAPYDGMVTRRLVSTGDLVQSATVGRN